MNEDEGLRTFQDTKTYQRSYICTALSQPIPPKSLALAFCYLHSRNRLQSQRDQIDVPIVPVILRGVIDPEGQHDAVHDEQLIATR
jgi:hypothetical protein